jgi:hypothetical protein
MKITHENRILKTLLEGLDLGSSVAESDNLLEVACRNISVFRSDK